MKCIRETGTVSRCLTLVLNEVYQRDWTVFCCLTLVLNEAYQRDWDCQPLSETAVMLCELLYFAVSMSYICLLFAEVESDSSSVVSETMAVQHVESIDVEHTEYIVRTGESHVTHSLTR